MLQTSYPPANVASLGSFFVQNLGKVRLGLPLSDFPTVGIGPGRRKFFV